MEGSVAFNYKKSASNFDKHGSVSSLLCRWENARNLSIALQISGDLSAFEASDLDSI